MRPLLRHALMIGSLAVLCTDVGAVLLTTTGTITSLRVEQSYAFIGFSSNWQPSGNCGPRVWVDISSPVGRVAYATALSAFNGRQVVTIRAFEGSQRVFSECNLYDIVIAQ